MTAAVAPINDQAGGFNRAGLVALIGLGVLFAAAFVTLTAIGPDMATSRDGGSHALSPAATGYSAIVELAKAAGANGRVGRDDSAIRSAGLLVLTPSLMTNTDDIDRVLRTRGGAPTLIVLPKTITVPSPLHPGWVQSTGEFAPMGAASTLRTVAPEIAFADDQIATGARLSMPDAPDLSLAAPAGTRSLSAKHSLDAVLSDDSGKIVIGWVAAKNVYILAEPDLINNHGIARVPRAIAAVQILRGLVGAKQGGIVFDVTLNGFGVGQSLLRTAFQPPFLALTLALLIAAVLAFWYGQLRFGTPQAAPRAIAFGKLALVENAASLIRMAGREAGMAGRYAVLMRDAVAQRVHAPAGLGDAALGDWIDRRAAGYAALAQDATIAVSRDDTLAAAKALHRWQETISNERR